ncbi:CHC2 zinc finger domain-containing protein [Citreimonas salinaria]|uniref:CHC2 zinc finger n=1 Tax=Citreimonas salinaria TaxID=321339 RepID=A0A1H3LL93_9RHOB|nr:CHC2 zinc finger domain-containing protein [Citreimonas salinaria]SDY65192.1 CHC2 zinc finger [Citreimonas salinaria]
MGEEYKGVLLQSRYDLKSDIVRMREMVDWLGDLSENVESIICDSKLGHCYGIVIKPDHWHEGLPAAIRTAGIAIGGHNGILVEANRGRGFNIDPDWGETLEVAAEARIAPREDRMIFSPVLLDRIREKVALSDLASRWVTWDTRKSNFARGDYWAPCPFHKEASASFHIDDPKGYYYCFGCQAKGDVFKFLCDMRGIDFSQSVKQLAFIAGLDDEITLYGANQQDVPATPQPDPLNLIQIKDIMVDKFDQENFLEIGVVTGWTNHIRRHPRLLRSLSWGDPDYPGNVLDLITAMDEAQDGSIDKLKSYIDSKFSSEYRAATQTTAFSAAKKNLGYQFEHPRNDIIGVMMPFGGFAPVYEAIKSACETTQLPAKRADEVWNHSVLINDILELINHSAVVICDLTGRNENVFYELGIAHAWGKPVIPITQNKDDVPFDLRHHRYLHYHNNSEGRQTLQDDLARKLQSLVGKR